MPLNVLSALDVKSLSAARHPSDSALSPASLVQNAFIPGIVMVRYISPNDKGRSGFAAIHDAMPTKAVRADSVQHASPFSGATQRIGALFCNSPRTSIGTALLLLLTGLYQDVRASLSGGLNH